MPTPLAVYYPNTPDKTALSVLTATGSPAIVVYGQDIPGLTIPVHGVVLTGPDGHPVPGVQTTVISQPPYWIVLLVNVPDGSGYSLSITDSVNNTTVVSGITIQPVPPFKGTISIAYPKRHGVVPKDFAAYGKADTTNLSGQLTNTDTGVPLPPVASSYFAASVWVVQFAVPAAPYQLVAKGQDSGGAQISSAPQVFTVQ